MIRPNIVRIPSRDQFLPQLDALGTQITGLRTTKNFRFIVVAELGAARAFFAAKAVAFSDTEIVCVRP